MWITDPRILWSVERPNLNGVTSTSIFAANGARFGRCLRRYVLILLIFVGMLVSHFAWSFSEKI